jgi:TATA-binding protein-associated factor
MGEDSIIKTEAVDKVNDMVACGKRRVKSGVKVMRKLSKASVSKMDNVADIKYEEPDEPNVDYHRCLIFAQHIRVLDIIERRVLQKFFPTVSYRRLDGSVNPTSRGAIAKQFNDQQLHDNVYQQYDNESCINKIKNSVSSPVPNSCDIRILLMTTRSCGLGLNLSAADTIIFVQHDWNPFVDLQAMDRAHRLGQILPVTVFRLLAESTIEARIANVQTLKKTLVSEVINDDNTDGSGDLSGALWNSFVES